MEYNIQNNFCEIVMREKNYAKCSIRLSNIDRCSFLTKRLISRNKCNKWGWPNKRIKSFNKVSMLLSPL